MAGRATKEQEVKKVKARIVKLDATPLYRRVVKSHVYKESDTIEIDIPWKRFVPDCDSKLPENTQLYYITREEFILLMEQLGLPNRKIYPQETLNGK